MSGEEVRVNEFINVGDVTEFALDHEESVALDESVIGMLLDRVEAVTQQRDALVSALSAVMATLTASAGSPAEVAAWNHARAVLAEHQEPVVRPIVEEWLAKRAAQGGEG